MAKQNNNTSELKPAKTCYGHIGGKLGELLLEQFVHKGWIAKQNVAEKHFFITEKGKKEFKKLGVALDQIHPAK